MISLSFSWMYSSLNLLPGPHLQILDAARDSVLDKADIFPPFLFLSIIFLHLLLVFPLTWSQASTQNILHFHLSQLHAPPLLRFGRAVALAARSENHTSMRKTRRSLATSVKRGVTPGVGVTPIGRRCCQTVHFLLSLYMNPSDWLENCFQQFDLSWAVRSTSLYCLNLLVLIHPKSYRRLPLLDHLLRRRKEKRKRPRRNFKANLIQAGGSSTYHNSSSSPATYNSFLVTSSSSHPTGALSFLALSLTKILAFSMQLQIESWRWSVLAS